MRPRLVLATTWQVWRCTAGPHCLAYSRLECFVLARPMMAARLSVDAGCLDVNVHGVRFLNEKALAGIQDLCDGNVCERSTTSSSERRHGISMVGIAVGPFSPERNLKTCHDTSLAVLCFSTAAHQRRHCRISSSLRCRLVLVASTDSKRYSMA